MTKKAATKQINQNGQSLVEVALFLPILVILLAGIVELSQLVITQNRVSNAARTATRFGANGGEDEGIVTVALNTITQTLEVDEASWDIWTIHGQVNNNGDGINDTDYTFDHVYGISNTQLFSTVVAANIKDSIWTELQKNEAAGTASADDLRDLRFVGTYILHDVESILGLDAFPALANFSSVRALTVMRVTGLNLEPTKGCNAFPIGVDEVNFRSVSAPGGTGAYVFPAATDFTYPDPAPNYNFFVNHQDDRPLRSAQEGYLFKLDPASTLRWLAWKSSNITVAALRHSLSWPGDSTDNPTYGYSEPGDPTDTSLNIGDYVAVNTSAATTSVSDILEEHVDRERTLRVVLYDNETGGTVRISGFAVFRIVGFNTSQGWLLAEFIRLDESCGQEIQTTP